MSLFWQSLTAGVAFGIWPLFMNKSGFGGYSSAAVFSGLVFLGTLSFALKEWGASQSNILWLMIITLGLLGSVLSKAPAQNIGWGMAFAAGFFGIIGLMFWSGTLANATNKNIGSLFVIMLVAQIAVPALYQAAILGQYSPRRIVGFLAAILAAYLLK